MDILEQQHTHLTSDSSTNTGPAAAAAAAAAAADEGAEDMEAPEQLLQMLNLTASLTGSSNTGGTDTNSSKDDTGDQAAAAAAAQQQQQQQQQRSFQQVLQQFGGVLKSVTNAPSCGAAVWGLLGRWFALQGQLVSSQEARLKQVGG